MARGFKGFNRRGNDFPKFEQDFVYTGNIQSFIIPHTALYKLEVWGASGGNYGGNGGYSIGYKSLKKGTTVYIVCGGQGGSASNGGIYDTAHADGGYNGGGSGYTGMDEAVGGGGGATHMALVTGTLSTIGKTSFVDNSNGLIVAGGGGGGVRNWYGGTWNGGGGGGTSGGIGNHDGTNNSCFQGTGGTQTSAGTSRGDTNKGKGGFGYGGNGQFNHGDADSYFRQAVSGGGGGLYGGGGAYSYGYPSWGSGGGGSGYIGGVPEITYHGRTYSPIMYSASSGGNGKARITLVK